MSLSLVRCMSWSPHESTFMNSKYLFPSLPYELCDPFLELSYLSTCIFPTFKMENNNLEGVLSKVHKVDVALQHTHHPSMSA